VLKAQGPTYDVLPTLLAMGVSGGCSVGLWNISLEVRWESYPPSRMAPDELTLSA